jgi:hypothetical protein
MDVPPVDDHQDVLVALCQADEEATSKVGRGPLIFVEGDGGAGEGNVEKQASVEGQPAKWRHRIALYADDMAAGANTLEDLFEIYKVLVTTLAKAGIQIKSRNSVSKRSPFTITE